MTFTSPFLTLKPIIASYIIVPGICFCVAILGLCTAISYASTDALIGFLIAGAGGLYYFLDGKSDRATLTENEIRYVGGLFKTFKITLPLSDVISAKYIFSWKSRPPQCIIVTMREGAEKKDILIPASAFDQKKVQSFIDEINRRVAERQSL